MGKGHAEPGFREWIAELLDVPADALSDVPRVIMTGYHELTMTGHRGVLEYTDGRIIVRVGRRTVIVEGAALTIRAMTRTALTLGGNIYRVSFED